MTFIRYVILLVFSFFIGFSISKYTSNTLKKENPKKQKYIQEFGKDKGAKGFERAYKRNGDWTSLYRFYDYRKYIKIIDNPPMACDIAYVIMKAHFRPGYIKKDSEFNLYSVNNDLWAVYDSRDNKLLLLFQKSNCKLLFIANQ